MDLVNTFSMSGNERPESVIKSNTAWAFNPFLAVDKTDKSLANDFLYRSSTLLLFLSIAIVPITLFEK
jgi:hypothetical protein